MSYLNDLNDPMQYLRQKMQGQYVPAQMADAPPIITPSQDLPQGLPQNSPIASTAPNAEPIENTELRKFSQTEPMRSDYKPSRLRNVLSRVGGIAAGIGYASPRYGIQIQQDIANSPFNKAHEDWAQGLSAKERAANYAHTSADQNMQQQIQQGKIAETGASAEEMRQRGKYYGARAEELFRPTAPKTPDLKVVKPGDYGVVYDPQTGQYKSQQFGTQTVRPTTDPLALENLRQRNRMALEQFRVSHRRATGKDPSKALIAANAQKIADQLALRRLAEENQADPEKLEFFTEDGNNIALTVPQPGRAVRLFNDIFNRKNPEKNKEIFNSLMKRKNEIVKKILSTSPDKLDTTSDNEDEDTPEVIK